MKKSKAHQSNKKVIKIMEALMKIVFRFSISLIVLIFLSIFTNCASITPRLTNKIEHEITIKGEIVNIEQVKPYITDNTCLQLVEYEATFTMIASKGTLMISSEFPMIKFPRDGMVEYKIKKLKYNTMYCIVVQMLDPEYSNVSKVLIIKQSDKYEPASAFTISKSEGEITAPTEMDLSKFYIPE